MKTDEKVSNHVLRGSGDQPAGGAVALYRDPVGQNGVCRKPGGVLSLRLFTGALAFPGGCGGDLSLPAGIKRVDVLRAAERLCSGMSSAACTVYPSGLHKEESKKVTGRLAFCSWLKQDSFKELHDGI